MSFRIVLILCVSVFTSCTKKHESKDSGESEKNFTHVEQDDAAMNAAIANAKKTSSQFMEALRNPKPSYHEFYVKKPYPVIPKGMEHMWIGDLREVGDHLEGRIANEPFDTKAVEFGKTVSVKLDEISDWKYQDGERLIGGYTIRYFYGRMSADEKKAFLRESGFIIE